MYHAANQFDVAAPLLRDVVFADPLAPDPEGLRDYAADLWLDSLNALAVHRAEGAARGVCFAEMGRVVASLQGALCNASPPAPSNAEFCARLATIAQQLAAHLDGGVSP